jgi:CubicO group peptidase (beta-lactamase class C family)
MKNILFAAAVCAAFSFPSCRSTASLSNSESIDQIMQNYSSPNAPGASVLVLKNDSIMVKKAYGIADMQSGGHIAERTNFRLASVTKQFTAMAVLMLSERNQLSLSDSLNRFFPDFPSYGTGITVRHLLNHTSGLVDYESLMPDTQTVQVHDADCLRLMFNVDSLYFAPGSRFQYSNTGYALLALIVEKVSGKRFAEFLKENIFTPVGMSATIAFEEGISVVPHRAYGHSFVDGAWIRTDQSSTSAVLGDGGIYSNTEDLALWISALWNYRLLTRKTQRMAWSDARLNDGTTIGYGMGWYSESYRGIRHPHHGGSTRGFRNHIVLFPDEKLMVVVLTNRNQGTPVIEAKKIADLFLSP